MTNPQIRPEAVDILIDQFEYGVKITPDQQALIDSATDAEQHAAAEAWGAAWDSEFRWITGQATPEEAELQEMTWTPPAIFEGLPATAAVVLLAMRKWPWNKVDRKLILPILAQWSPEDRALLEERFALTLADNGVHWDG